jgi:DNA-binding NtrC family response regulator
MEEIAAKVAALGENPWRFVALRAGGLGAEQLEAALGGSEEPTVLAFLEADALAEQEATAIMDFVEGKGGSGAGLRTIFCLSQPVEDLYDAGKIDEEFYLFLGTNELRVPALREMPEDMLQYVQEEVDPEGGQRLDMKTRQLLLGHSWPENFMELQSVVLRAVSAARPLKPDHTHFHAALYPDGETAVGAGAAEPELGRFLRAERDRYAEALRIFNS